MKPTNINIGKYFGIAPETLSKYNNGKKGIEKERLYDALKKAFISNNKGANNE